MPKPVRFLVPFCCLALTLAAQQRSRGHNLNISTEGNADSCATLQVHSDGEIARADETYNLLPGQASAVELSAMDHAVIQVRGWDQTGYRVEACKIAVAADRATAGRILASVNVSHSAGRFSNTGPSESDGDWQVYYFVHTPPNAGVDLETKNGPVSVADVHGSIKLRATNGPLAIRNCSGNIDAQSTNGPIAFDGDSGEVHLHAHNGPIAVKLSRDTWNGAQLDAQTDNGPVSLKMPSTFRSGVRIETDGNAPLSCKMCDAAAEQRGPSGRRVIEMNGSSDTVRVSTHNGPVSISNANAKEKIL